MANGQKGETVSFRDRLQFQQSYTSLILGVLAVVVVAILIVGIARRSASLRPTVTPPAPQTQEQEKSQSQTPPTSYTVVAGDTLWSISEKYYKSGYNWVDIAKANSMANPDVLDVGTTLSIPKAEAKVLPLTGLSDDPQAIGGGNYTVVKGDTLWDIAVRAYGDGYRWIDIAKVNKLADPDVIDEGQTFTIPR